MKLGPDMYLLNTFHIPKNEFVNVRERGASKKTPNNSI